MDICKRPPLRAGQSAISGRQLAALLVDDEPQLRLHLQKTLGELWPELEICGSASNGEEAVVLFEQAQPDLVFMDIHMPGTNGLEAARQIRAKSSSAEIIFLTAYDEHAVAAFEQYAIDYLLKPLDEQRLRQCIERLQLRYRERQVSEPQQAAKLSTVQQLLAAQPKEAQYLKRIKALKQDVVHVIPVDQVLYFEAEDTYTTVYTQQGEYLTRLSLKELESQLDPEHFWRTHRSLLVNAFCIDFVKKTFSGEYQLAIKGSGKKLPISRRLAPSSNQ